jgi:hypothetical protein
MGVVAFFGDREARVSPGRIKQSEVRAEPSRISLRSIQATLPRDHFQLDVTSPGIMAHDVNLGQPL